MCNQNVPVRTGILLYSESDLQHADYWVKSEGRTAVYSTFQESWKWVYVKEQMHLHVHIST